MKILAAVIAGTLSLAALSACGSTSGASTATATVTATTTVTATPTKAPAAKPSSFAPNVGVNALSLGQTRHGSEVDSTLLQVERPMVDSIGRTPAERGQVFMGIKVKTCAHGDVKDDNDIAWSDWQASDKDGGSYPASSDSWDDWPEPQYPTVGTLHPGECKSGWLLIPVPKSAKVTEVQLAPSGDVAAEWHLS